MNGKLKSAFRLTVCGLVAFLLLFVDQYTKLWADTALRGTGKPLIPELIYLRYTGNTGIAFGIGSDNRPFMIAVLALTAVLIVAMVVLEVKVLRKNFPLQVAVAVIWSGAVGNFIDRLFFTEGGLAAVRDFVDLTRVGFGVCNIADFCITGGAVALVYILLFIGPGAAVPLKRSWREEAKRAEAEEAEGE